jgi:hypothetical protein
MRYSTLAAALFASGLVSGCGGGGGGVASTPTPTPTPTPTAANTLITDLRRDQTFSGGSTTTDVKVGTADGIVQSTQANRGTVTVRYDAAAKSYTIETDGRTQTFTPADARPQENPGETRYVKSGAATDYLTLVTTPYYFAQASNRYVAMGYWQRNSLAAGIQTTAFSTFTFGMDTPASAIPRNGSAHWRTDIFGLLTTPGTELRTVQGAGSFDVDFAGGIFAANANLDEYDFVTGGGRVGSLVFQAGGQLTSGNGFSGNFSYGGSVAVAGTLSGTFYGPAADEIGATFQATDQTGGQSVLTGAMTGQRDTSTPAANQTLLNVTQNQRLVAHAARLFTQARDGEPGFADVKRGTSDAFVTITPTGPGETQSESYGYTPVAADQIASSRTNFTAYQGTVNGQPLRVDYYKPGSANTELALTYTSFATWSTTTSETSGTGQKITNADTRYILYGLETPRDLLSARTGSASYRGVVYGGGANREGLAYDIGGTSRFDVDFSAGRYAGSLTLSGRTSDGTSRSFGNWDFAAALGFGQLREASFDNAPPLSTIQPYFFGPDGQEIGATFKLATGPQADPAAVFMSGVALAKRQ